MQTRILQRVFGNSLPLTLPYSDGPDSKLFNSSVFLPTSGKTLYLSSWATTIMLTHIVGETFRNRPYLLAAPYCSAPNLDSPSLQPMSSHARTFVILLSWRIFNAARNAAVKAGALALSSSLFNVAPPPKWCRLRSTLQPKLPGILAMTGPVSSPISLRADAQTLSPSPRHHEGRFTNLLHERFSQMANLILLGFTTDESRLRPNVSFSLCQKP